MEEGYKRWSTLGSGVRPIVQFRFGNLVRGLGVDSMSREQFFARVFTKIELAFPYVGVAQQIRF